MPGASARHTVAGRSLAEKGVPVQILALVGSPRKGGNTDLLVDELLSAAEANGHSARKVRLAELSIGPCRDCRACKRREDHSCAVDDDMVGLSAELEKADVIVFGTPIYWYGPSAQMKPMIDRLRAFSGTGKLRGKTGVLVLPSQEGPACCGPTIDMFALIFSFLGMRDGGSVLATAYDKGEVLDRPEDLAAARRLGQML
jgi:multimeric flavodoxin WrbA